MHGLCDLRVVDFSSWIAGSYVSKLLADAGAEVIKVENGEGDPLRRWSSSYDGAPPGGEDSAFFQFLNSTKRSLRGEPNDPEVLELVVGADLVIEDFPIDSDSYRRLDIEGLRRRLPHLVILSITPFGRTGPYAARPASEFTVQAESGCIASRGLPSDPPHMVGGRTTDFVGAAYAAGPALATVRAARAGGQGEHIDLSLTEAMNLAAGIYQELVFRLAGQPNLPGPYRSVEIPSIEPTLDGWVGFNTNTRQQFDDFLVLIERPDLIGDEGLANLWSRAARMDEWNQIVREYTTRHTTAEIVEKAALFRIPVAPVNNGCTVLEHEHFKARGVFETNPGGGFRQPGAPYRINGGRIRKLDLAPALGEANGRIAPRQRPVPRRGSATDDLPLAGLRVLDATSWWAGPSAAQMLAMLGADVIHLESTQRLDGGRTVVVNPGADQWWEMGVIFTGANTNKRSLTLNLADPKGLAVIKRLIGQVDIMLENYSPRVFEQFGLDWGNVRELNPEIVYARMPAFGLDGPWRNHVGFAQTMEQITGLAWLTGHKEDQPRIQRGPCDPLAGLHAMFAIMVGLMQREATGEGQFLECPMVEPALNAAAEQVVEYSAYGHILEREGNRSPYAAPQGIYPCRGEENWLALSVTNDAQWRALVELMGRPDWALHASLSSHAGRRAAHDVIDEHVKDWVVGRELQPLVETLLAHGVPAAMLQDPRRASSHPQLAARGFFELVEHPVSGTHPLPGAPFRFASRPDQRWNRRPAPTMGQHNHAILSEVLGLSEEEIVELEQAEIIGTRPTDK